jgi:hypothetical protein
MVSPIVADLSMSGLTAHLNSGREPCMSQLLQNAHVFMRQSELSEDQMPIHALPHSVWGALLRAACLKLGLLRSGQDEAFRRSMSLDNVVEQR